MATKAKNPGWEIKDRVYVLNGQKPLTYTIRTKGFLHFDEEKGINREIRYATNQNSLFVDEQDGNVRLGHVMFEDGVITVSRRQPLLTAVTFTVSP